MSTSTTVPDRLGITCATCSHVPCEGMVKDTGRILVSVVAVPLHTTVALVDCWNQPLVTCSDHPTEAALAAGAALDAIPTD